MGIRAATRVAVAGVLLLLIIVFYLNLAQLHPGFSRRPLVWIDQESTVLGNESAVPEGHNQWPHPQDKIVVVPKIKTDDVSWVAENLPDWQHAIYYMDDDTEGTLHPPKNKGREAMAYLTYLVDHYNSLPSTIAFIHSHRDGYPAGWHTDAADYDNVNSLRALNIDFVQKQGYANLRCVPTPGCPDEVQPFREPYDNDRVAEHEMPTVWPYLFGGNISDVPRVIGAACCGQFAVSRTQVLSRPWKDYARYRDWLLDTPLPDYASGRVLEYLWHVIFGRDPVYCPDPNTCYCDVYGRC